jgi:predicted DNA-binding transcriptional regulator AlpA
MAETEVVDEMLTAREVCEVRKCGNTKLWEDVKNGLFPRPVFDGPRSKRWFKSEVAAHQAALKAERDKQ